MPRQPARALIQLAIGELLVPKDDRNRIRRLGNLRRKQIWQCDGRERTRSGIPVVQDVPTFIGSQKAERADRLISALKTIQKSEKTRLKLGKLVNAVEPRISIEINPKFATIQPVVYDEG